jgi:hypothetical protein
MKLIQGQALFTQLEIDNSDGRLSGEVHRGRFPHTLYLQPQASVVKGVSTSYLFCIGSNF